MASDGGFVAASLVDVAVRAAVLAGAPRRTVAATAAAVATAVMVALRLGAGAGGGAAAAPPSASQARRAKRKKKACDWIVANDVSGDVMGGAENTVLLITPKGTEAWPRMKKEDVAA